jgi:hypothetical protein
MREQDMNICAMNSVATNPSDRLLLRPIIALIGLIIIWGLSMPVIQLGRSSNWACTTFRR